MQIKELNTSSDLLSVAELYGGVFRGYPWLEVSKCPDTNPDLEKRCGCFSSLEPGQECPTCKRYILVPAYPIPETADYIKNELTKSLAVGFLATENEVPIAFGWGYALNGVDFAKLKYKKPTSQAIVAEIVGDDDFFYVSEVGVDPEFQGQKLGKQITSLLAQTNPLLMRTNQDSRMAQIGLKLGMQPIIGLDSGKLDPENPSRVVFTRYEK